MPATGHPVVAIVVLFQSNSAAFFSLGVQIVSFGVQIAKWNEDVKMNSRKSVDSPT
jgi:hypothetical protein